jgi:surface protein
MNNAFLNATNFNQDITGWSTQEVVNMNGMFNGASAFNQNISGWNIGVVTDMSNMLVNTGLANVTYTQILIGWAAQAPSIQNNVTLDATPTKYYIQASDSINTLTSAPYNWTINDGGLQAALSFEVDTTAWDSTIPVINTDSSFTTLTTNTYTSGTKTIVNVEFVYASITNNDGLKFYDQVSYSNNSSLLIYSFNSIPLSISGSQLRGFTGTIQTAAGVPTILSNTSLASALRDTGSMSSSDYGDIANWITTNAVNMSNMFDGATNFDENIGGWNTANVTDVSLMFFNATSFNQNIDSWNISSLSSLTNLFLQATSFNSPLNSWDVSNITDLSFTFDTASSFNQPLNNWNVSNVTTLIKTFSQASVFNQDLSSWNVSNVSDMNQTFENCPVFNQPLNSWNTTNVTNMPGTFQYCALFNQPLDNWVLDNVTIITGMFEGATNFNQDITGWNTSNVSDMSSIFMNTSNFNQDISGWNTSAVTSMNSVFYQATNFNQNLASWNIPLVTNMEEMLYLSGLSVENYSNTLIGWAAQAPSIQSNVTLGASPTQYNITAASARNTLTSTYNWTITDGGPSYNIFKFNLDTTAWDSNIPVINTNGSFTIFTTTSVVGSTTFVEVGYDYSSITGDDGLKFYGQTYASDSSIVITDFASIPLSRSGEHFRGFAGNIEQTASVPTIVSGTSLGGTFRGTFSMSSSDYGDIVNWNTTNVVNMSNTFDNATNFDENIGGWNTSLVTDMSYMFNEAPAFNQSLNSWGTSSVTDMSYMFDIAQAFNQSLNLWDTSLVTDMSDMFSKYIFRNKYE